MIVIVRPVPAAWPGNWSVTQLTPTDLPALLTDVQRQHAVHAQQRGTRLMLTLDEACHFLHALNRAASENRVSVLELTY